MLELKKGRPEDETGRLEKEIRVYDFLDKLNIEYYRVDHYVANTMEACAEIDEALAPGVICKNLLLCNQQKTKFYMLMIKGDKKFVTKDICRQIESPRLSFAPGEYMERLLDITPGSLSIMGLMNDINNEVKLLVDRQVLESEYLGCHPCINTSSMRLKTKDVFETYLQAVGHDYTVVEVD